MLEPIGQIRLTAGVPPGGRDKAKATRDKARADRAAEGDDDGNSPNYRGSDRALGDFLIWEQTILENEHRQLPVLLICNENKPDWVRPDGDYRGPRPELVKEMADRTG